MNRHIKESCIIARTAQSKLQEIEESMDKLENLLDSIDLKLYDGCEGWADLSTLHFHAIESLHQTHAIQTYLNKVLELDL